MSLLALPALLFVPAAAAAQSDVTIRLAPGEEPDIEASLVNVRVSGEQETEWIEFNLSTPRTRIVVTVVSDDYFRVNRPRQVVPELGDHFFFESDAATVRDPASGGRLVNGTRSGDVVTLELSFPVAGAATLRLTRDVTEPAFTVGEPYELEPYSFLLKTETDEYALATVTYWEAPDGEAIPLPTTVFAFEQTFPVQGLDDDTEYVYRVEFWDWAKNRDASDEFRVRTPPLVTGPDPVVTDRAPEGDYAEGTVLRAVEANYTTPAGVIDPHLHVRLFVDLTEVTHLAEITASHIRYAPPEPFAPGFHRVGLEVANSEGGAGLATWTFTIAGGAGSDTSGTPGPGAAVLAVALAGAVFLRRRRAGHS